MKIHIKTFGCQMNDRDSELVVGQFLSKGYCLTDDVKKANVILLNTCSVREHAEHKVWSELGSLKSLQANKPIIGVIGCMAKNVGSKIIKRMPHVDIVCSPNDLDKVYRLVENSRKYKHQQVQISSEIRNKSFYKHFFHSDKKHSYVNISEGCSNFCSYCVVPYVRGRHRSRLLADIIKEVKRVVNEGINSITLLGQNVNDYSSHRGKTNVDFVNLLDIVSDINGIKDLGFVTSHPKDINFELFDLMAQKKNIRRYLHLPVQSGSNRVLKLMNRKYTRERYFEIIRQYRKSLPGGILATDVIVGFPGETEGNFKDTVDLMKKVKFNFAYIFKYSLRPHTRAEKMVDSVSPETKAKRHKILLDLQRKISKTKKNERW